MNEVQIIYGMIMLRMGDGILLFADNSVGLKIAVEDSRDSTYA